MTDQEKATFLANLLARQKIELDGAREAFRFTQAYQWLLERAKKQEKEEKSGNRKR